MGKHVSEQSRHLKTKDEPQEFPEIDEIDEESCGAKKAKRGFADCGSISFGGIAPVVFAAVLLVALSFLLAEGWMKCVAFLIPFVIAGFAILMDAIDKLIERKYFEAEQITLIAAIAVFAIGRGSFLPRPTAARPTPTPMTPTETSGRYLTGRRQRCTATVTATGWIC